MKKLGVFILIMVLLTLGFYFARNIIAKTVLTKGIGVATGLTMQISDMNVGILDSQLGVKGVKLLNPKGFDDKVMLDLPELFIDYDMGDLLKKKVHLNEVRFNLKQLMVVTNSAGQVNLDAFKMKESEAKSQAQTPKKETPKKEGQALEFAIDKVSLKVGKVILKDYSKGQTPSTQEFDINIDIAAENITNMEGLINLVIGKALLKAGLGSFGDFDPTALVDTEALQEGAGGMMDKAKEGLEGVGEGVKGFLKFGE